MNLCASSTSRADLGCNPDLARPCIESGSIPRSVFVAGGPAQLVTDLSAGLPQSACQGGVEQYLFKVLRMANPAVVVALHHLPALRGPCVSP